MAQSPPFRLYESPDFQAAAGPALRPGGLEITRRALDFCTLPKNARVADMGCGTGATVRHMKDEWNLAPIGLDLSGAMLDLAGKNKARVPFVRGDAACPPFKDGSLSAVFCECVLSLVDDPDEAVRQFYRVLAPDGCLAVADIYLRSPEHGGPLKSLPGPCCLRGAGSKDEWMDRISRNGFAPFVWEDHSPALKRLAARLVFSLGSLQALWGPEGSCAFDKMDPAVLGKSRPGYFLVLARKKGGS